MTTVRRILALAVIGAFVSAGLLVSPSVANVPKTYHRSDNGRTVKLYVGQSVRVDLQAPSGIPYEWVVLKGKHSTKFKIVSRHTYSDSSGLPGAPVHTVWTLSGVHPGGTSTFKVALRSVTDKSLTRRFTLHVRVIEAVTMRTSR